MTAFIATTLADIFSSTTTEDAMGMTQEEEVATATDVPISLSEVSSDNRGDNSSTNIQVATVLGIFPAGTILTTDNRVWDKVADDVYVVVRVTNYRNPAGTMPVRAELRRLEIP